MNRMNPVTQITREFAAGNIVQLKMDIQVLGNVRIYFDAGETCSVSACGDPHLMPDIMEYMDDTLFISAKNLKTYLTKGQREKLLLEIHVPEQTKLSLNFLAGVVILEGGTGQVKIKGWSGEVSGRTYSQDVHIKLHCGDVSLRGLPGKARIEIGLGSASLGWAELGGREDIDISCRFGGVDLLLPLESSEKQEEGGILKKFRMQNRIGSRLKARVGFGGLDVLEKQ